MIEYTKEDIGCYFDGAFGFDFNAKRLIDFAVNLGFKDQPIDYEDPDDLVWLCDAAEEWLNDNTTRPDNTHWSWEDGDFGLWQYDEDGELA